MADTSKRGDAAAPTEPAAGLDAFFGAMRLDDPPSLSQPQPQPLRVPVPTARADALRQLEMVRQYWPQPEAENSAAAEHASFSGSRGPSGFFASHFGAYSPRFNALAAPFPSVPAIAPSHLLVSPSSSMPGTSTNHYQPTAGASQYGASLAWDHNAGLNPFASAPPSATPAGPSQNASTDPYASTSRFFERPYASTSQHGASLAWNHDAGLNPFASAPPSAMPAGPSRNASIGQYASASQPRTAAAASSFVRHDSAGIDPYASASLSELHAYQVAYDPRAGTPAVRRVPTLQEVRWRLLGGPMDPALAMSPQTAEHVVRLLQKDGEEVRRSVLAGVKLAVHSVMQSRAGCDVFRTLLRARRQVRFDELCGIVDAVCSGNNVLMDIMKHEHGVAALKVLIVAVAPHHQLSVLIIIWLLREGLTEHCRCVELVRHCFAKIPYGTCSCMIRFAIYRIDEMFLSSPGSLYLAECFENARNNELRSLEEILIKHTGEIAMGQYSNYFLQRVLQCGRDALKERIAERVAADVAALSLDKFGSYVVEACFRLKCSLVPMRRVLLALLRLPVDQLGELVRGANSNYVVHKLLAAGRCPFPKETTALARRIEKLPAEVQLEMYAQRVMCVVKKLFPRKRHY